VHTGRRRRRSCVARSMDDLGRDFGTGLTEAEVAYCREGNGRDLRPTWSGGAPSCAGA
jgi:hypothetical protein